ncbi:hypothetical protein PFISCL1PPCAC_17988 [Pristionchus fissidentatus]|uniref:Uncharacterized protein n=1 Tax=Pristionchus fissidentatus TaxID=1538716 RepID=A0AAV5W7D0_9BILA|nr:hypothetical protein PFISCL1PPCAC_17988 [Pristionchus fissidentatus]
MDQCELLDECVRLVCGKLRILCDESLNPSTMELRAFVKHVFVPFPSINTDSMGESRLCPFYRRLFNRKTIDISRGDVKRTRAIRKAVLAAQSVGLLTQAEFDQKIRELAFETPGSASYISILDITRLNRNSWKESSNPSLILQSYPTIIRDFQMTLTTDLFSLYPKCRNFTSDWNMTIVPRIVSIAETALKSEVISSIRDRVGDSFLPIGCISTLLLKGTNQSSKEGRINYLYERFPSQTDPRAVVQSLRSSGRTAPSLFQIGSDPSFRLAIETYDIPVSRSPAEALLALVTAYYSFSYCYPMGVRDVFQCIEELMGIKPSAQFRSVKSLLSKINEM